MEGGIDHTRLHTLGNLGTQYGLTCAAANPNPIAFCNATVFSIVRMNFNHILMMPGHVLGTACLRTHIVLRQDTTSGQDQRIFQVHALSGRHILGNKELALTAHKFIDVHGRRACRCFLITWPLDTAQFIEFFETNAGKGRCQRRDLIHDFAGMRIMHRVTQRF